MHQLHKLKLINPDHLPLVKEQRVPRIRSKAAANLFAYVPGSRISISGPSSLLCKLSCALRHHKSNESCVFAAKLLMRGSHPKHNKKCPARRYTPAGHILLCFSLVAYRDYSSSANSSVSSKKPSSSKPSSEFSNSSAKS